MPPTIYAVLTAAVNGVQTIENVIVADQAFVDAAQLDAVPISSTPGSPSIGWTTTDGGKTWAPPAHT